MIKRSALALCCVLWAVTCFAQTTAIRPDQISPATPDITWGSTGPGGGYQVGSTVPWRTDSTNAPTFTCSPSGGDIAKIVELTNAGVITATLPAASGCFGDGAQFTIQMGSGSLNLTAPGGSTISGQNVIAVAPYQSATLLSRGAKWYAQIGGAAPAGTAAGITFVQYVQGTNCTTGTTCTVSATVTTGNLVVLPVVTIQSGGTWNTVSSVTTSNATTCAHATATLTELPVNAGAYWASDMWYCQGVTGGTVTFTYHTSATISNALVPSLAEFSGVSTTAADTGKGNGANAPNVTTLSVSPTSALTQNNQLLISSEASGTNAPSSVGPNQITMGGTNGQSYQVSDTSGSTPSHTYNYSAAQLSIMSLGVFAHP